MCHQSKNHDSFWARSHIEYPSQHHRNRESKRKRRVNKSKLCSCKLECVSQLGKIPAPYAEGKGGCDQGKLP